MARIVRLGVGAIISSLCFQFAEWPGSFLAGESCEAPGPGPGTCDCWWGQCSHNGIIYCCHGGSFLQLILNIPETWRRQRRPLLCCEAGHRSLLTTDIGSELGPVIGNSPDSFNLVVRNISSPRPLCRTHLKLKHWPSNLKACWTSW